MWGNSIASRVKKVINQRVEAAQKEHDAEKVRLEKELEIRLEEHASGMVEKIIGKISQ